MLFLTRTAKHRGTVHVSSLGFQRAEHYATCFRKSLIKTEFQIVQGFGNMLKRANYLSGKFVWPGHSVYLSPWINVMGPLQLKPTNLLLSSDGPLVFITSSLVPPSFDHLHNLPVK